MGGIATVGDDVIVMNLSVFRALRESGMDDVLLFVGSAEEERQFAFHVLEVISLMFREQTAEQLAASGSGMTDQQRQQEQQSVTLLHSVNIISRSVLHVGHIQLR